MGDNLKKNMMGALAWSSINIVGTQFIQLIVGIILARILVPEDFGTIGVLFIFIGLSTVLIDGGFGQGLIRKQDTTEKDLSTIFYLNFLMSIALYTIMYFGAPFISIFFAIPELTTISRVLFLSVILFSFYFIQQVQLYKKHDYKSLAIINIVSIGFSGTLSAILALKGFGVWALVLQQIVFHLSKALLFPFFLRWKPIKAFTLKTIKELWSFSINLLGQITLNVIFNNIYIVIIGKFYPIQQVGYFTQANKYSETVNTATQSILFSGTFPVFAQIQDDQPRLLRVYRRLATSISLVTFPIVFFLIVTAYPLFITVFTDKWIFSVLFFQTLILANIFTPLYTININILNVRGESKQTLKLEIFKKTMIVLSIICCFSFGIEIMLIGLLISNFLAYGGSMVLLKKSINHYFRHQILDFSKILIIVVFIGFIVYLINYTQLGNHFILALQTGSFLILYLIALKLFFPENLTEAINGILNKLKSLVNT